MITSLQALRFIFALFIFAEHFPISPEQPSLLHGAGAMGVSFFLVLSGFVMSIGYEQRVQEPSFRWGDFILKRLIRLWPLHLLCLGVWIILAYAAWGSSAIHPLPLLGNALLLQWLPVEGIEGNNVAWCLPVLVLCYAIYPALARLSTQRLLLATIVLAISLLLINELLHPTNQNAYWYKSPASRALDFLLGMLTFRIYQYTLPKGVSTWSKLPALVRWSLELLPIPLYALALVGSLMSTDSLSSIVLFYFPSCLVIFLFALSSKSKETSGIPDLLNLKWLIYLGQISFSFYMAHNLVILAVKQVFQRITPSNPWELRLVVSLATAIVVSILINRFFEAPIADRLSKFLPSRK